MLFFVQTLPRILCTGAISRVSFFDLFGPITGITNPITFTVNNFSERGEATVTRKVNDVFLFVCLFFVLFCFCFANKVMF